MKKRFWQKTVLAVASTILVLGLSTGEAQAQYSGTWHDYSGWDWTLCPSGSSSCTLTWVNVHTHFDTNVIHTHQLCGQPTNEAYWNNCWTSPPAVPAGADVAVICWHYDLLVGSTAIFDKIAVKMPTYDSAWNFGYEPDSNVILRASDREYFVPYCNGKWPN